MLLFIEPWAEAKKKRFKLLWRCQQLLFGFLAECQVSQFCRLMIRSWYRGCAQISWHLPYGWGKPRKSSDSSPSDESCVINNRLKWGPLPPNESVGSHSKSEQEKEEKKERIRVYLGRCIYWTSTLGDLYNILRSRCFVPSVGSIFRVYKSYIKNNVLMEYHLIDCNVPSFTSASSKLSAGRFQTYSHEFQSYSI